LQVVDDHDVVAAAWNHNMMIQ